jgi:hypothetical protein
VARLLGQAHMDRRRRRGPSRGLGCAVRGGPDYSLGLGKIELVVTAAVLADAIAAARGQKQLAAPETLPLTTRSLAGFAASAVWCNFAN